MSWREGGGVGFTNEAGAWGDLLSLRDPGCSNRGYPLRRSFAHSRLN